MASMDHVLVVGASSGIGFEVARQLAEDHIVSAIARREDRLSELNVHGVHSHVADIADVTGIAGVVQAVVAAQGPLKAIVYCAGKQNIKPLRSQSPAEIQEIFMVNVIAAAVLAGQFASKRVSTDDAIFCAISSIAAERPERGIVAYGAAKAGLESLIKGMARELGPRRAVAIAPGWIDTEMTQAYPHLYNDAFRDRIAADTPAVPASVEDVVHLVRYLISPAARSITGQIIRIDGGISL